MKMNVGLWIDHKRAVIVLIKENGEETKEIESGLEKHVRFSGEAQKTTEEDISDRKFTNQLNKYYDEVISNIQTAGSILVMGPGEAKTELCKRIESKENKKYELTIETVDKLTDNQIAAKIKKHFNR
jgi:stalled ribosome rescue protein Dom34